MTSSVISVTELKTVDVNKLLSDKDYKIFFPTACNDCTSEKGFNRRIFLLTGVAKKKQADEATQDYLCEYFFRQYKIINTFFRSSDKKFYAESASCQNCQSTSIVFGVDTDYFSSLFGFSKNEEIY